MRGIPGYWMNETSGVLRPAVEAFVHHRPMTEGQIAAMRGYLRQWIEAGAWKGPMVDVLRAGIPTLTTQERIRRWIAIATDEGMDPL